MTTRTPPSRTDRSRSLPAEWDQLADRVRLARVLALTALVAAVAALAFAAAMLLLPPQSCQEEAWRVEPASADLPSGWTFAAAQYDLNRKTMSFVGPYPEDEYSAQAGVLATVTCFEQGAAEAVTRSRRASEDADQLVDERSDLGDQAFSAVDVSGAIFLQLRAGRVVVYLAGSPDASATEVDQIASAFDTALGGDGGMIAPPTIAASGDPGIETFDPGYFPDESQAAPDLVAMLPTQVGDVTMGAYSYLGSEALLDDQWSRAVLATLREAGREADDLRVAQAYDELDETDLSIVVLTVDGMPVEQTRDMVLDLWLAASGPGVAQDSVELAGTAYTRIDYGDGLELNYVRIDGDAVIVITTADPALAEETAAAMP